jgi:hypothetical protein
VNVVLVQNAGGGMHVALSELVDPLNDGVCVSRWPTDRSKDGTNIAAIVTVFGAALFSGGAGASPTPGVGAATPAAAAAAPAGAPAS